MPLDSSLSEEFLQKCKAYIQAFYLGTKVKLTKPVNLSKDTDIQRRKNCGHTQYNAMDFINKYKNKVPADAYCMIAITSSDIYPGEKWNFVFGMASLNERVGLFSLARYDPSFFDPDIELDPQTLQKLIEFRACKVMTHELGHMFGLKHCIYYHCAMCGSMHADEASRRPMHLCPICLRKLQLNLNFDYVKRYKALIKATDAMENKHFETERVWLQERVQFIEQKLSHKKSTMTGKKGKK